MGRIGDSDFHLHAGALYVDCGIPNPCVVDICTDDLRGRLQEVRFDRDGADTDEGIQEAPTGAQPGDHRHRSSQRRVKRSDARATLVLTPMKRCVEHAQGKRGPRAHHMDSY